MAMKWDDRLRLGITKIDAQHKALFDCVDRLTACAQQGKGREEAVKTIAFLNNYVKIHFADEEELQREIDFPGYTRHCGLHQRFIEVVHELQEKAESEGASYDVFMEVANAVNAWLVSHIKTEDMKIAQYINAQKAK